MEAAAAAVRDLPSGALRDAWVVGLFACIRGSATSQLEMGPDVGARWLQPGVQEDVLSYILHVRFALLTLFHGGIIVMWPALTSPARTLGHTTSQRCPGHKNEGRHQENVRYCPLVSSPNQFRQTRSGPRGRSRRRRCRRVDHLRPCHQVPCRVTCVLETHRVKQRGQWRQVPRKNGATRRQILQYDPSKPRL